MLTELLKSSLTTYDINLYLKYFLLICQTWNCVKCFYLKSCDARYYHKSGKRPKILRQGCIFAAQFFPTPTFNNDEDVLHFYPPLPSTKNVCGRERVAPEASLASLLFKQRGCNCLFDQEAMKNGPKETTKMRLVGDCLTPLKSRKGGSFS